MDGSERTAARQRIMASRRKLLDAVEGYCGGPLAKRLGAAGRPARVEPVPHGKRSMVYVVDFDGLPRTVFRAVLRFSDAWKLVYNHRHFLKLGLPVPRLLAASLWPPTRLRWGFWPVAEEYVEGRHLDQIGRPEPAVRAVAGTLARMHNVQRRRWGWPVLPRWGSYRRHLLARMHRRARDLEPSLEEARADELITWCRQRAAAAPLDAPFSLTHSRIYTSNFILTPDNRAVAIDLLECRFGTFGTDVIWALKRICAEEPEICGWFLDAYFAQRPDECRAAFDRSLPFFDVDYHLARAGIYSRRFVRRRHVPSAARQKLGALREHVARLTATTGIEMAVREP